MVKEIAGIKPLTISVLNDQDALLEFDLDVIVTSVCRVMQGIQKWGEKEIEICCMAGTKEHLVAIEKSREEFRRRQEELDLEKEINPESTSQCLHRPHIGRQICVGIN